MHIPENTGGGTKHSLPTTEQQLLHELMSRGISVRLLSCIGLPEARRAHMEARLKGAIAFRLPSPSEVASMSEEQLDIALAAKGVSTRLLSLIGIPAARVNAKREAIMFSE